MSDGLLVSLIDNFGFSNSCCKSKKPVSSVTTMTDITAVRLLKRVFALTVQIINAFSCQSDNEMKAKVASRLNSILDLQRILEKCLKGSNKGEVD